MDTSLLAQLAALPEMEASEMKALWKRLYQKPPPPFNRSNYIKRLAYRIQELAYGVDSRKMEKRLELYARQRMDKNMSVKPKRIMDRPITGTRLMRGRYSVGIFCASGRVICYRDGSYLGNMGAGTETSLCYRQCGGCADYRLSLRFGTRHAYVDHRRYRARRTCGRVD